MAFDFNVYVSCCKINKEIQNIAGIFYWKDMHVLWNFDGELEFL